ncbi:MAG TPA: site-specific integrase [Rariglobus sp.]
MHRSPNVKPPPRRRLAYQVLTYTGQRKAEVAALVWSDLVLSGERPQALFRDETMKDGEKRAVSLHPCLVTALANAKPSHAPADAKVFRTFPRHKTLMCDLRRAGIAHKDATGRVLHFHSFRKTFQTLGARHGIGQRSAQELLGHSDPRLTADVYTDVAGLELHAEIQKLPWPGEEFNPVADATAIHSLSGDLPTAKTRFENLCFELLDFAQTLDSAKLAEL